MAAAAATSTASHVGDWAWQLVGNATTMAENYLTHPEEVSAMHKFYQTVDVGSLNMFEKAWMNWYQYWDNPVIATGLMSFLLHEVFYFGRCIPWIIIDSIPYFRKWKLQDTKIPSPQEQWRCTKYVLKTHFTVELPQIYMFHPLAVSVGMSTYEVPFPHWTKMLYQIAFFFIFEDAWHYFMHRLMHHRLLYKHVHKLHHEFSAPFGLAAEYSHPIEILVLGMGTIGGPLLWCYFTGDLHIVTMYIWIVLRLFQAVDSHSGYDFPISLNKFFPLWAGADHHDYHHQAFKNCYSTSFRYLDWFFGTDKQYHAFRDRQKAEKKAKAEEAKMLAQEQKAKKAN